MTSTENITIGSFVVQSRGRASSIGRRGTVVAISGDPIGTGGDRVVTVNTPYGETFQCYDRQLDLS